MLVAELSQSTVDRREMSKAQIDHWARMFANRLVDECGGTVVDVFTAANKHLEVSQYFPTLKDLIPLVKTMVERRQRWESSVAAARNREPRQLPALPTGEVDYSRVPASALPDDYDYQADPHYRSWMERMERRRSVNATGATKETN